MAGLGASGAQASSQANSTLPPEPKANVPPVVATGAPSEKNGRLSGAAPVKDGLFMSKTLAPAASAVGSCVVPSASVLFRRPLRLLIH